MKKNLIYGISGLIAGALIMLFAMYQMAPGMMLLEDESKYARLGLSFADRSWFKKAMESKKTVVSDFYISNIVDELCISVSKPIISNSGEIIGIFCLDINFDNLIKRPTGP